MVVGAAASGGMAAAAVATAVAIVFNIYATSVARMVGPIFRVLSLLLALLACGDASPDPLPFAATFPFAVLG